MDWHMYLILFIAMILFIGIVLFAQRMKKQPKDPLSVWNEYSEGSDRVCSKGSHKPYPPHNYGDVVFDPAFSGLSVNIYHDSSED
jgi:hypothetical protein